MHSSMCMQMKTFAKRDLWKEESLKVNFVCAVIPKINSLQIMKMSTDMTLSFSIMAILKMQLT